MSSRAIASVLIAAAAAAITGLALGRRSGAPPPPVPVPPVIVHRPEPPPPPDAPRVADPGPPRPPVVLAGWRAAIINSELESITQIEIGFRGQEETYRESLVLMAQEDEEPRVRAFCVTLLSRFTRGPKEDFFIRSLADGHEYPREAAVMALERLGTAAARPALDRMAQSDPIDKLRLLAGKALQAVSGRK